MSWEQIAKEKIFFVGNIMIDSLKAARQRVKNLTAHADLGLKKKRYALLTLHRPENVDDANNFKVILDALKEIQKRIQIVFPIHPRTEKQIKRLGLINHMGGVISIPPLGYLKFLNLMLNSLFVLTDSGGIQEETTVLNIPCLTLRKNTERPVTVTCGTNLIVGIDKARIAGEAFKIIDGYKKRGSAPKLWDGKTAERIINIIANKLFDNGK